MAHPWRLLGVLALKLCNVVHVYACFMCSTDFSCEFIFTVYIYILNLISWVQSKSYRTAFPCVMC